jgi:hypothetical protein
LAWSVSLPASLTGFLARRVMQLSLAPRSRKPAGRSNSMLYVDCGCDLLTGSCSSLRSETQGSAGNHNRVGYALKLVLCPVKYRSSDKSGVRCTKQQCDYFGSAILIVAIECSDCGVLHTRPASFTLGISTLHDAVAQFPVTAR